ncbi:hypothetical protein AB6735_27530 [Mucilaginibacter sp. RCC_168]|uniref:hypothetical protein n=1 Tax=Mucilaginibacter sp. RCC_168 TaxID=3239221 RepID=UPI0035246FC5
MKMKFILSFLITVSTAIIVSAQAPSVPAVIPPSPDVAALLRYAEIPVGYSTGVPDINVPIYTIKTGKLILPISISYHASGIKVRDMASVVGLGWVLNAGGSIGRTVLGRRDESNDYIAPYKTTDDLTTARNAVTSDADATNLIYYYQNMSKSNFETQSDRYGYNFNGKSGIFRYDWLTGGVHLIPYAPLKITKQYLNNSPSPLNLYYQIVDEEGAQYSFQATEVTSQNGLSPVTAWNLTKITSADQTDEINLYYKSGTETIVQASEVCSIVKGPSNFTDVIPQTTTFTRTPIGSQEFPQRLDSIVTKDAVVRFLYAADRQDGRQMRLIKIAIYSRASNSLIREASLIQTYFGAASNHSLRLRLDGVKLGGAETSVVENYAFGYNNGVGPGYYMTNGYVFPGGNSFPPNIAEDYWGYNTMGIGGIPSEFLGFLNPSELGTYGGNKNPHPIQAQLGILQQIQYPTGGKSVFEFESNKTNDPNFYHYPDQTNPNNYVIGGLRIKTIKNYNSDNSLSNQKSYTYDLIGAQQEISAVLFSYQQPVHYVETQTNQQGYAGMKDRGVLTSNVATSSSVYPLSIMGSSPVIYGQVTEYNGTIADNVGKTEYSYDIPLETTLESTNILGSPKFINGFTIDRGTPNPLLKSKVVYKNVNGTYSKVSQVDNTYTSVRTDEFLTGIRVDQEIVFKDLTGYFTPDNYSTPYLWDYLNSYTWEATKGHEDVALLTNVATTDYSNVNSPVSQTTTYTYANLEHLQPTQKTVTSSTGDNWITQYKYPSDFVSIEPYDNMYNTLHNWTPVIEQLDFKYNLVNNTTSFLQSSKTDYQIWNNNNAQIYPLTVSTKKGTNNYEPRQQFQSYDTQGDILSLAPALGPKTSYQWGYNNTYPTVMVKNALNTYKVITSQTTSTNSFSIQFPYTNKDTYTQQFTVGANGVTSLYIDYGGDEGSGTVRAEISINITGPNNYNSGFFSLCLAGGSATCGNYSSNIVFNGLAPGIYTLTGSIYDLQNLSLPINLFVSYPISVTNTTTTGAKDFYYDGFEEGSGNSANNDCKTGHLSFSGAYSKLLNGLSSRNYVLSYWLKSGTGWTLQRLPPVNVTGGTYTISIPNGQIDDVRFCPVDAQMTTYTYDPLVGMTSSTDAKGETTTYEYDGFQRLMNVKDKDGNIVKHMDYHYQGQ